MNHLIVCLGNPGKEYEVTRHNIAWLCIDQISFFDKLIWKEKFKGLFSSFSQGVDKFYFIKPLTYMNLSGQSVQAISSYFKISENNILVLHDELDFPYGTIALKQGGGLAGHNGLKSIAEKLGTKDFKRLRLGIGRPTRGSESNWVLSPFSDDEFIHLGIYLKTATKVIELYMKKGFSSAASRYSKQSVIPSL